MSEQTPRQLIRDWWRAQMEQGEPIDLKQSATKGALTLRQDKTFCDAFLDAFLVSTVYDVGMRLLSDQRGDVRHGTRMLSRGDVIEELERDQPDWSKWMEHDPASGKHLPLLKMSKEQILGAAMQREGRANEDNHRAALLRLVAGRLQPGQLAGAVWTEDELTVLDSRVTVKIKTDLRPMDRLLKGAAD